MAERLLDTVFFLFIVVFIVFILLFSAYFVYEISIKQMIVDCINNGGIWLSQYSIGCTYPAG